MRQHTVNWVLAGGIVMCGCASIFQSLMMRALADTIIEQQKQIQIMANIVMDTHVKRQQERTDERAQTDPTPVRPDPNL